MIEKKPKTVSFCVIAFNEEDTIQALLDDLINQTYPKELIEVVLVDGLSTDNTRNIMSKFKNQNFQYQRVIIVDNEKKIQPSGWNKAILEAKGDIILRIDAHASIPKDFIEKNVGCIESGEMVCGGYRPNIIDQETPWKKTLLSAESSMFGSSIAPYRRSNEKHYVKSIFHGAYRSEVFEKVGGFNESLKRTEDNELHYRIRKAGYNICFDPKIVSYQHARNSLRKMIKQKYLNGFWIGKTLKVCPKCLSWYHFVPACFVLGIMLTSTLLVLNSISLFILMWSAYLLLGIVMMINTIVKDKFNVLYLLLPIILLLLHSSYGIGTIFGVFAKVGEIKYGNRSKNLSKSIT